MAETERLLLAAVERRLDADVPVGSLLSAGIDSGLVCWAVKRLGADLTAFTVGTPGDPEDESRDACATAAELGIRHEVLPLSPGDEPRVDELISAYGEPFACASALGMLGVSRQVRRVAKVLLTGDGGDDVFLGYPRHRHLWLAQMAARMLPRAAGAWWRSARGAFAKSSTLRRPLHFVDYVTGGLGAFVDDRLDRVPEGVAGLKRGGDRDQKVGELVVERLDPHPGLELDVEDREGSANGEQRERHEGGRNGDGSEQAEHQAAAEADIEELRGAQRHVGALELPLEIAEVLEVRECAVRCRDKSAEERASFPRALRLPHPLGLAKVRFETRAYPEPVAGCDHEGAGEQDQEADE